MPHPEVNEQTIPELVHEFYRRVRADATLGPVFDAAIPDDSWPAHLERMCRFWSSVMLASGRYSGNPVAVHRGVGGMAPALFPRWMGLFEATARDLFAPAPAAALIAKAHRIADSMAAAVFFRPGGPLPAELLRT